MAPTSVGLQQMSFVKSIVTTKGGKHVDYVVDQVVSKLMEVGKKKFGKSSVIIKNFRFPPHVCGSSSTAW